jgi:hypothetical protein
MCLDCDRAPTENNIAALESRIDGLKAQVSDRDFALKIEREKVKERDAEIYRLRRQFQLLKSYNNLRVRLEHERKTMFFEGFSVRERASQAKCCVCVEDMRKYAEDALAMRPKFLPLDWP